MAEPDWHPPAGPQLRVATTAEQLADAGERLCMAPAALAAALVEPAGRLLLDDAGSAVLLRRQWADDGAAEVALGATRGRARTTLHEREALLAAVRAAAARPR